MQKNALDPKGYYGLLGVDPSASPEQIKQAYLFKVHILHPDRMGAMPEHVRVRAEEELKQVNQAYDVLGNPAKRREYDRTQGNTASHADNAQRPEAWPNRPQPLFVVGVCGRSGSGKSALTEPLASINHEVILLQADCYFHRKTSCTYNGYQCWEHTNCIDFERMIDNFRSLKEGRDTVIHIETPWMPHVDVKISREDLRKKKMIILDGFLIFAVKGLVDLLDCRLFIHASDSTIKKRRVERNGPATINYIQDVVIPVSKEYENLQRDHSDMVVDGNKSKEDVLRVASTYMLKKYHEDTGFTLNLPFAPPWKVYPGDLVTDRAWHPIDFTNLKEWVKSRKRELDAGKELKGNTFRYRRNPRSMSYEVRLSSQYNCNICRYTCDPTPSWR